MLQLPYDSSAKSAQAILHVNFIVKFLCHLPFSYMVLFGVFVCKWRQEVDVAPYDVVLSKT